MVLDQFLPEGDGKAHPVIPGDGVQLVAGFGAVEVDLPVHHGVVHGDGVGPPLVSHHGEDAVGSLGQQGPGLLLGELPVLPGAWGVGSWVCLLGHCSETMSPCSM